jgi:hypothetical protein
MHDRYLRGRYIAWAIIASVVLISIVGLVLHYLSDPYSVCGAGMYKGADGLCDRIQPGYMESYFYGECMAAKTGDESYCDLLLKDDKPGYRAEQVSYCHENIELYMSLEQGDVDGCRIFRNASEKVFHSNESDYVLCEAMIQGKNEGYNTDTAGAMCMRLFGAERFVPRCMAFLLSDPSYCWDTTSVDDRMKCLIYSRELDCDRIGDVTYLRKLLMGTDRFAGD